MLFLVVDAFADVFGDGFWFKSSGLLGCFLVGGCVFLAWWLGLFGRKSASLLNVCVCVFFCGLFEWLYDAATMLLWFQVSKCLMFSNGLLSRFEEKNTKQNTCFYFKMNYPPFVGRKTRDQTKN